MSDSSVDGDGEHEENRTRDQWPVPLESVTESVVTTLGPNERWNAAALGLFAGGGGVGEDSGDGGGCSDGEDSGGGVDDGDSKSNPITAKTWGNTRTRRNFHRVGEGYVQFPTDPVEFVDAALSISESDDPILESAAAWVRVSAQQVDAGVEHDTEWERWELTPLEGEVVERRVPTISRGLGAVVEATVAASRLGVTGYDDDSLRERLEHCASVVDRAGSSREIEALERVRTHSQWSVEGSAENESL